MPSRKQMLTRAASALRESKHLDFKREFRPESPRARCELIKDVVAMANTGGGVIVFGVDDNGLQAAEGTPRIPGWDQEAFVDQLASYTGHQFADFELIEVSRLDGSYSALVIDAADVLLPFVRPGTFDVGGGKQKSAFSQGTVYFRHGSKSEPAVRDDLMRWRNDAIALARKTWLSGIRRVVEIDPGKKVAVVSADGSRDGAPIRAQIVPSSSAISVMPVNAETIWPLRQKDVVAETNARLPEGASINAHDIQCLKRQYRLLDQHPQFAYRPHPLSSPQYSHAFVEWIVKQYHADESFFRKLRLLGQHHSSIRQLEASGSTDDDRNSAGPP